jgi:hypothetical protein
VEVGGRAAGRSDAQVGHSAGVERASRPEPVAASLQDGDRVPQVLQGRRVLAQTPQHVPAPVQDPARHRPAGELRRAVQGGQPGRGPARLHEGDAQGGQDVGLPLHRACPAGQAEGGPELGDAGPDITEIAQDNSGSLARD